jgi:hypothetical protein
LQTIRVERLLTVPATVLGTVPNVLAGRPVIMAMTIRVASGRRLSYRLGAQPGYPSPPSGTQSADRLGERYAHRRSNLHLTAQAQRPPCHPAVMVMMMWDERLAIVMADGPTTVTQTVRALAPRPSARPLISRPSPTFIQSVAPSSPPSSPTGCRAVAAPLVAVKEAVSDAILERPGTVGLTIHTSSSPQPAPDRPLSWDDLRLSGEAIPVRVLGGRVIRTPHPLLVVQAPALWRNNRRRNAMWAASDHRSDVRGTISLNPSPCTLDVISISFVPRCVVVSAQG